MPRHRPIITLTTDFGCKDHYVSAMKAIILGINRDVRLIDVSHDIPPQDIMAGAWILKNSAFLYPKGTIHLAVIDPGVGTKRDPIVLKLNGHYFVGPNNGLFSLLFSDEPENAWRITNKKFLPDKISGTFHGRDIFAPVAAHLSNDIPPESFGPQLDNIASYRWATPIKDSGGIQGWVVHIDRYGNLITNIPSEMLVQCNNQDFKIYAGTTILHSIVHTFADVTEGDAAAIVGSCNMLEIVVNKGSAEELLNVHKGAPVSVVFQK